VVAGKHGGAVLRQPLAMTHCQAQRDKDHGPHDHREK
jgi:hypothetical protein